MRRECFAVFFQWPSVDRDRNIPQFRMCQAKNKNKNKSHKKGENLYNF